MFDYVNEENILYRLSGAPITSRFYKIRDLNAENER